MTPALAQTCWIAGGLMLCVGIVCTLRCIALGLRRIFR